MKNVPNLLSIIRICLVPVFVGVYFGIKAETKILAVIVFAVASVTDFLDGYIARKYNASSNLGRVLDPLGDKLMTLAAMICITIDDIIPSWVVVTYFIKEVMQMIGGLLIHKKAKVEIPPSNYLGKMATLLFIVVCLILMIFTSIPKHIATIMIAIVVGVMLMALGSYIMTFIGVISADKKRAAEKETTI